MHAEIRNKYHFQEKCLLGKKIEKGFQKNKNCIEN